MCFYLMLLQTVTSWRTWRCCPAGGVVLPAVLSCQGGVFLSRQFSADTVLSCRGGFVLLRRYCPAVKALFCRRCCLAMPGGHVLVCKCVRALSRVSNTVIHLSRLENLSCIAKFVVHCKSTLLLLWEEKSVSFASANPFTIYQRHAAIYFSLDS